MERLLIAPLIPSKSSSDSLYIEKRACVACTVYRKASVRQLALGLQNSGNFTNISRFSRNPGLRIQDVLLVPS